MLFIKLLVVEFFFPLAYELYCHVITMLHRIPFMGQGSTLEKKPWGQLAPEFFRFGSQHKFFGCQKFSALRAENFYLKNPQYRLSTPQDEKPCCTALVSLFFIDRLLRNILIAGRKCYSCNTQVSMHVH